MELLNRKSHIPVLNAALVALLYGVFYCMFGADIIYAITYALKGNYSTMMAVQVVYYALLTLIAALLLLPVWKESAVNLKRNGQNNFLLGLKTLGKMYVLMIALNITIGIIVGQDTSANQESVNEALKRSPVLISIFAVVLGPIFEELVFRGAIYRKLREKGKVIAMAVSSLLFGFIHVYSSLFSGNYKDMLFIITYAALGYCLGEAYEKSGSIYVTIGIHMVVNLISTIVSFLTMMICL